MNPSALLDPRVEAALEALPAGLDLLQAAGALRDRLPRELVPVAAELRTLRARAAGKLPGGERAFLTRRGLEQATDRRVAGLRARRLAEWLGSTGDAPRFADLTAGIGGDALALLEAGLERWVAADASPGHARLLARNLERRAAVLGRTPPAVVCARAESGAVRCDAALLDPDRRTSEAEPGSRRREGHPERWSPRWSEVLRLVGGLAGAAVKLPPAVDVEPLDAALPERLPRRWQWTSLRGELKEVTLWTGGPVDEAGDGRAGPRAEREASLVRADGSVASWRAVPRRAAPHPHPTEVRFLAEPDPAVIRAGLIGALAETEELAPLAREIAYLGGDRPARSPLTTAYEVLGCAPLDRRRVRRLLAAHDVGPITVKKRGHPDSAKELARRLRGGGRERGLLVVARLDAGHFAYLVRSVAAGPREGEGR